MGYGFVSENFIVFFFLGGGGESGNKPRLGDFHILRQKEGGSH